MSKLGLLNGGKIPDHEYNAIMLKVPAFTLEGLLPQLTHDGFKFCLYKGNSLNAPIDKIGVYGDNLEGVKQLTGNRFKVDRMNNQHEIWITIKK